MAKVTRAELKKLATSGDKKEFHRIAAKFLKEVNELLGVQADIRKNLGGAAVTGEAILHSDTLYVQVSNTDLGILYRTCKGRKDYSGGRNNWYSWKRLAEYGVQGFAAQLEQLASSTPAVDAEANYCATMALGQRAAKTPRTAGGPDFIVDNQGSIFLLSALTESGKAWVAENIPSAAQTWGGAIVVEHRYIADIVAGIRDAGLEVK